MRAAFAGRMARILIVYHSTHGTTEMIAQRIADRARERGAELELVAADDAGDVDWTGRDAILVAGRVHFGRVDRKLRRLVKAHRKTLEATPSAFASVGLQPADPATTGQVPTHIARFVEDTGWRPRRVISFAGALPYTRYNRFLKWLMSRMVKTLPGADDTSRDHVYTDGRAVDRFADELAEMAGARLGRPAARRPVSAEPRVPPP